MRKGFVYCLNSFQQRLSGESLVLLLTSSLGIIMVSAAAWLAMSFVSSMAKHWVSFPNGLPIFSITLMRKWTSFKKASKLVVWSNIPMTSVSLSLFEDHHHYVIPTVFNWSLLMYVLAKAKSGWSKVNTCVRCSTAFFPMTVKNSRLWPQREHFPGSGSSDEGQITICIWCLSAYINCSPRWFYIANRTIVVIQNLFDIFAP